MTWLYVLLGIILFLVLILLIPIGVKASFKDELKAVLKIGFIPVQLYPPKPKKEKKKKKKKPEEPKDKKKEKPKKKKPSMAKEKGIMWLIDTIQQAAALATGALKSFFRHLVLKRLNISIIYHGEDADDTAVKYGYFCLAVYPAASFIHYFRGDKVVLINKSKTINPVRVDLEINEPIGQVLGDVTGV